MIRIVKPMLVCAVVFSFSVLKLQAQSAPVVGDTYIQSGTNAGQNFGAQAYILAGPGGGAPTQNQGLIQFDLSAFNGVTGSELQKAVLWLYVDRIVTAGSIDVFDVTSSWSEGTATWNAQPTVGANQGTIPVTSASQWVGLDITSEVRGWLTTPSINHGVALLAFTAPTTAASFDTKENISTSHPAQLHHMAASVDGD